MCFHFGLTQRCFVLDSDQSQGNTAMIAKEMRVEQGNFKAMLVSVSLCINHGLFPCESSLK